MQITIRGHEFSAEPMHAGDVAARYALTSRTGTTALLDVFNDGTARATPNGPRRAILLSAADWSINGPDADEADASDFALAVAGERSRIAARTGDTK